MMKDQKRRMTLKEYGPYKLRYNAIRKAELLPPELRVYNHYTSASTIFEYFTPDIV